MFQFIARHSKDQRYTPEFKKLVVETMMKEKLSYSETARQFEINDHKRVAAWERIYLEEGPEGFVIERRQHSTESCKLRNGLLSAHRKAEIVYRSLFAPEWHSGEKFHTKLLATIVLYVSLHG